jgi:GST-like protein
MSLPTDLFVWPSPNGWSISIAIEEMGLPYSTQLINIRTGNQFAPEFLRIAPNANRSR